MYDNVSIGSTKEAQRGGKLDQKPMKMKENSENGIIGSSDNGKMTDTDDEQGWTKIKTNGSRKPKMKNNEQPIIDSIITTIDIKTKKVKNGTMEVKIESPVHKEEEKKQEEDKEDNEEDKEERYKKEKHNNKKNKNITNTSTSEEKESGEERIVTMANEQAGDKENRRLVTDRTTDEHMQDDGNDTENTNGSEGNNGNNESGNSGNNGNNDDNNNNNNNNNNNGDNSNNNNNNRKRGGRPKVSIVAPTDMETYTFTIAWRPENKAGKDGKIIIKNAMREMQHREPTIIFHPTNSATSPVPRDIININNDFPKTPATYDDFFDQNRNRDNTNQQTFMKVSMPHNEKELQNKLHNYLYHNQLYMNSPFINDNTLEQVGFVEKGHSRLVYRPTMEKKISNGIKEIMNSNKLTPQQVAQIKNLSSNIRVECHRGTVRGGEYNNQAVCEGIVLKTTKTQAKLVMELLAMLPDKLLGDHYRIIPKSLNQLLGFEIYGQIVADTVNFQNKQKPITILNCHPSVLDDMYGNVKVLNSKQVTVQQFILGNCGAISIEETNETSTKGKYIVIVPANNLDSARTAIGKMFQEFQNSSDRPAAMECIKAYNNYPLVNDTVTISGHAERLSQQIRERYRNKPKTPIRNTQSSQYSYHGSFAMEEQTASQAPSVPRSIIKNGRHTINTALPIQQWASPPAVQQAATTNQVEIGTVMSNLSPDDSAKTMMTNVSKMVESLSTVVNSLATGTANTNETIKQMMIQQAETNKQMMIQQTTTMTNQTTTMNNLMMLMTKNEERRQGSLISEIQPVIDLQQGSTPASTLTNSQYSLSQEQSTSSNKRPKHGLDDDETTALSTVENGTSDEPDEGEQEDMIEEQMEATTNEESNDVKMGDNDQTRVETTNTANLISRHGAAESSDDDSSEEDTPRRRRQEQLPIETRLEKLKEEIERISSVQRGNRMTGLQERNREDGDNESDNEEGDDNMPGLQDRNREDSDSEDDEEEEDENSGIKTKLVRNNEDSSQLRTKLSRIAEIKTKLVRNNEDPSQLRTKLSRIAEIKTNSVRNSVHNTINDEVATTVSMETTTTRAIGDSSDYGTEINSEEDLFFEPSDDDFEEEDSVQNNNNYNNENKATTTTTTTTTTTPTSTTPKKMKITQENLPFGHICDDVAIGNDTPYVRVYCQNVCGIYDRDGIGLDSAFNEMKKAGADIFTFNETHGDESNALARRATKMSKQRMWRDNNEDCKILHSSSTAPVLSFTKPGGNMVGITGSLVGRIRETITDPYGRWCGYTLIGKDNKEIMVLTAYNVSQHKNAKVGDDTLYNQQTALYKLKDIRDPDPKKLFIEDLTALVKKARMEDKDIILTGDFNELVGDDPNGMVKVISAGGLTDAHSHQHGIVDITTYTRGVKRLDYVFVTPRLVDHILRSGYESFHSRIASDHRGYFVDFALAGFLDRQLPSIFSASSRAIRGTHPKNITKYVEHLHKVFKMRDIYRRVKLQKNWYEKKKLEALDREITAVMLEAEEQCRIHHREPWSEEVNEVMTTANILRIHLSSLKNNIDCSNQIQQKQLLLKNQIQLPDAIAEASKALSIAQKKRRKLIRDNRTKTTSIGEEQEAAYVAMNPEMDAKRAAQIFQRARDTKQMMSELPSKMNGSRGLSAVRVPLPKEGIEIEYLAITDGPTIERIILEKNIRHFRQAEFTPLASPEVIRKIGFGADTETAEHLLDGTGDPTDITDDEWARFLLTSMKRNSEELKIEITAEKMMEKYTRWNERTSTSPSGRHLGHFHALFRPLKAKNKKDRERLDDIRQDIIDLHATMLQTAYDNEHVYKRWEYILTCMLAKETGIPRIHRLRVIHLYECDLNLLFSLVFRELDQHCEDNFLLNKGVYGCRPNRRAMDPVFVDVTQNEMAMVTRKALVKFNNDATACFDRILVHLLSLCLQSFGCPKKLTKILGELLRVAKYAIKTGIGISKETYQHSDESPAFGSGQGSAASAQGWTKLVSMLFDIHDKYGHGCKYEDPWRLYSEIIGMLGFVDDNNITNNGEDWETVNDIIIRTQHDAQLWNDLLRATGGALNLDKCFAQVLAFQFGLNGAPVIAPADPTNIIIIKDRQNNKDVIIKPISPYTTYRFLGTEQGTSKNQKSQQGKLVKTSATHNRKLACSAMSPKCAWVHYSAVFLSSVGYPLSMCHLSQHQLHDLQKKYIPTLLNKISIARTHAHALVFGPRAYGGVGCNDLRIEQGLDAVQNLIRQLRTPGYGKQLAMIFLRTFQHASGLSKPLLEYPGIRAPHLEGHYYVHIRRFLAKHRASLEIECIPKSIDERIGDTYIMDLVCVPSAALTVDRTKLKHYTDAEINQIHYCKSYLQVKRISDLCTADGAFILPSIAKGERSIRQCTSKLNEITQERPGDQSWTVWRKFLKTICKPSSNQGSNPESTESSLFAPRIEPRPTEPGSEPGPSSRLNLSTEPRTEPTPMENRDALIENEGLQQRKDVIDKVSIGTFLLKYWVGVPFRGIVMNNTGKYYKILYEDGDEEELNHTEVVKYEKKYREEGRMTGEIGQRMRLTKPLGDWLVQANDSERLWPYYYSEETDTLYRSFRKEWHTNGEYYYDCHMIADNDTYNYVPEGNVERLPNDASPTDVMDTEDGWRISEHHPIRKQDEEHEESKTIMQYLQSQEEHVSQYYAEINFLTTPFEVYELIKSPRKYNIATDGGAIPLKGSLGFVVADEDGTVLLSCYGQPSGNDPLSFRSEICALLAAAKCLQLITEYYDQQIQCDEPARGKIQVYTDSLSMIKKLEAYDEYPTAHLKTVLNSEWDVLSALSRTLKKFRTYPKLSWVKSHQDDMVFDEKAMPLDAYLNSEADELATIGLKRLQEKPIVPMDPNTCIQFHIEGRTITRNFKNTVREIIQLKPLRKFYCIRFKWSDNIFDLIDWDVFRPVYKKRLTTKGIAWMHKFCIKKLPTGERVHKRDHFHDKRCASCLDDEDDDHILQCDNRRSVRKKVVNQINVLRKTVDKNLCDILQEGLMAYFKGDCMSNTMFRIRGGKGMGRYKNLIDEQTVIGWDNLLRGKFSKEWRIQQKAYKTRLRLVDPIEYDRIKRQRKRQQEQQNDANNNNKTTKRKNKTEEFHGFFQSIVPIILEMWTDRCIDRNTPVLGGRIAAEYDSLCKQVTHLYTLKEMVLPEDEIKIYDETLLSKLADTNQQLKKWINRWRPVIDHSMKRVKELAQDNRKPIWQHFTKNKPAKTKVSRKTTKQSKPKKYSNNPLTNVYTRLKKKRSSSRVLPVIKKIKHTVNHLISTLYNTLGKKRSTSREQTALEVGKQVIDDRYGDEPK
ncbi:hypothetical protein FRACYDRAFT_235957 [Fragilariopsis cylindrus CCMP1102]|uniref:RNase H type-1 domain-containing protein n=1 Tax=Fragilariopsis cylindrus CCMP1102 TaxID=635003 RepID=A0A1E7FP41_9STRA|nr:hypothetical protein FRACYDRAFT_235957 [Fragilariopsis cylindrus CCMP1102]|eukprot:OEU19894.1 hypothetical protein FRACYDRAFT_235957 [Fragilariopsis cylindrus CCMP1102]